MVMRMYAIFKILLQNYEKAVHAHNYRLFWKGLCFKYLISTLCFKGLRFLKVICSGWISTTPPTFILEEELIQYKCNLIQFLSNISEIIVSQKAAVIVL